MKKEKRKIFLPFSPFLLSACRAQTLRPLPLFLGRGPAGQLPLPLPPADRWGPSVSSIISNRQPQLPLSRFCSTSSRAAPPPLPRSPFPRSLSFGVAHAPEPPSPSPFALPTSLPSFLNAQRARQKPPRPPHVVPSNQAIYAPILRAGELYSFPAFFSIKFHAIWCLLAS